MRDWTVLITVAQLESQPAITEEQSRKLLGELGGENGWIQYPPASGRGHGFETRWWQSGEDAGTVAIAATERYEAAVRALGLHVRTVLVHVASPEDRLNETTIGLERRLEEEAPKDPWNVMLRAIASPGTERRFPRSTLDRLLALLPGNESSGFARDAMAEVRLWTEAVDAVDATDRGARAFLAAMEELGYDGWTIVRAHATSVDEAKRTAYFGVQGRVLDGDPASLPIAIRI